MDGAREKGRWGGKSREEQWLVLERKGGGEEECEGGE